MARTDARWSEYERKPLTVPAGYEELAVAATMTRMRGKTSRELHIIDDPVEYARERLGEDPWEKQEEILRSVHDNERTAVPKCHSSGGTRAAAMLVCYWLERYEDGVVYTLAPTWTQIRDLLWRDIEDIHIRARLGGDFHPASARWEFGPRNYAIGRSTDQPERLQGPHGGHFLLIIDEASGFPEDLEPAVEGMLASGETRVLLLSQPTRLSGMFWQACGRRRGTEYNVIPIDAADTPNFQGEGIVRPYLIKPEWAEARRKQWGETNPLYQIRVRGRFPKQATDTLISMDWIEGAFRIPDPPPPKAATAIGCDVARFGADQTAYAETRGAHLSRLWRTSGKATTETAGQLKAIHDKNEDIMVVVDDTGVGGGVTDNLREQDVPVRAINFGAAPERDEDMADRGSEIWWQLAEGLQHRELTIDPEIEDKDDLMAQLVQVTYTFTSKGKVKVQKKGKDDKLPSPDLGDAWALANDARVTSGRVGLGGQSEQGAGVSGPRTDRRLFGGGGEEGRRLWRT